MGEAEELAAALGDLLAGMSPRTRRPIRFLEGPDTQPAAVYDSALTDSEGGPSPEAPSTVVPINRSASSL
jgi:hypothetical protein